MVIVVEILVGPIVAVLWGFLTHIQQGNWRCCEGVCGRIDGLFLIWNLRSLSLTGQLVWRNGRCVTLLTGKAIGIWLCCKGCYLRQLWTNLLLSSHHVNMEV